MALMAITVFQKPYRLSQSEFIIPYSKFMKSFSQQFSAGLRFKMRYEGDDASERRLVCSKSCSHLYTDLLWLTHESIMQMHRDHSRNW
jgi:hypothetical protein